MTREEAEAIVRGWMGQRCGSVPPDTEGSAPRIDLSLEDDPDYAPCDCLATMTELVVRIAAQARADGEREWRALADELHEKLGQEHEMLVTTQQKLDLAEQLLSRVLQGEDILTKRDWMRDASCLVPR